MLLSVYCPLKSPPRTICADNGQGLGRGSRDRVDVGISNYESSVGGHSACMEKSGHVFAHPEPPQAELGALSTRNTADQIK
jgi:hypothetical protein